MKTDINYNEYELEIDFDWANASGDGWNEPHEPAHVEQINSVMLGEHDIYDLLSSSQLNEIEEIVFEKHIG
jgi:hypothetical protein